MYATGNVLRIRLLGPKEAKRGERWTFTLEVVSGGLDDYHSQVVTQAIAHAFVIDFKVERGLEGDTMQLRSMYYATGDELVLDTRDALYQIRMEGKRMPEGVLQFVVEPIARAES